MFLDFLCESVSSVTAVLSFLSGPRLHFQFPAAWQGRVSPGSGDGGPSFHSVSCPGTHAAPAPDREETRLRGSCLLSAAAFFLLNGAAFPSGSPNAPRPQLVLCSVTGGPAAGGCSAPSGHGSMALTGWYPPSPFAPESSVGLGTAGPPGPASLSQRRDKTAPSDVDRSSCSERPRFRLERLELSAEPRAASVGCGGRQQSVKEKTGLRGPVPTEGPPLQELAISTLGKGHVYSSTVW